MKIRIRIFLIIFGFSGLFVWAGYKALNTQKSAEAKYAEIQTSQDITNSVFTSITNKNDEFLKLKNTWTTLPDQTECLRSKNSKNELIYLEKSDV